MTDWLGIIDRAAYTRFCRTGDLGPFRLKRADLLALAQQVAPDFAGRVPLQTVEFFRLQVRVPVPSVGAGLRVSVDEWTAPA